MNGSSRRSAEVLLAAGVAAVVLSRLSHLRLVWIEEAYGMAAAAELLRGRALYTDLWFDKPPLYAWFYTLCGALPGWPLRVLDVALVLLCAGVTFLAGRALWNRQSGVFAAAIVCFALTFWIPSAVMAVAPDLLLYVPHVAGVWAIATGRPVLAGALAGVALHCNSKGLIVLATLLLWDWRSAVRTLAGFGVVLACSMPFLPLREYWQQVWWWGSRYSSDSFIDRPVREFLLRTSGWAAFHATAVLGSAVYLWRTRDWRIGTWLVLSLIGVVLGLRFFPRYYFLVLPVIALAGAHGLTLMPPRLRRACLALLLIPVARFGPRYVDVALHGGAGWSDAALMEDSRQVAAQMRGGSLLVWGYRPDVYVFSGAPAGTPFLDSQPLTGVLADRHLTSSRASVPEVAERHRLALSKYRPHYVVDGLGPLNPELAITRYADLREWLSSYEEVARTPFSVLWRRRPDGSPASEKR